MTRTVYTIGHSNRTLGELISILKLYRVAHVVDVRRFPRSRRVPWFNRNVLEETLPRYGLRYTWLGGLLGGFRSGGYEAYMAREGYRKGIARLMEIIEAEEGHVAVMCRERYWRRCHRRFIADTLAGMGYMVVHIMDVERSEPHSLQNL